MARRGPKIGSKQHGMSKDPTYTSWQSMLRRCKEPSAKDWKYYGARGVKICEQWNDFHCFLSDMGIRPLGKTLDRIDPNGDYEPANCVWSDIRTQNSNRRHSIKIRINGVALPFQIACEQLGVKRNVVYRYKRAHGTDYQSAFEAILTRNLTDGEP